MTGGCKRVVVVLVARVGCYACCIHGLEARRPKPVWLLPAELTGADLPSRGAKPVLGQDSVAQLRRDLAFKRRMTLRGDHASLIGDWDVRRTKMGWGAEAELCWRDSGSRESMESLPVHEHGDRVVLGTSDMALCYRQERTPRGSRE